MWDFLASLETLKNQGNPMLVQRNYWNGFHTLPCLLWLTFRPAAKSTEPHTAQVQWSEEQSAIHHLDDLTFDDWLMDKGNAVVMFYTPWSDHCKKAKPEYTEAANEINNTKDRYLAAVDCANTGSKYENINTGSKY